MKGVTTKARSGNNLVLTDVIVPSQVRPSCEGSIAARAVVGPVSGVSPEAIDAGVFVSRVHGSREEKRRRQYYSRHLGI